MIIAGLYCNHFRDSPISDCLENMENAEHFIFKCSRYNVSNFIQQNESFRGRSGGAMVLGKLPVPGCPTIWITVRQGPIALAVGAGGGGLDIFTLIYPFSSFSLSLGDGPI